MHLLPSVAIWPNLELKTQPKQLLGSLPLVIALPAQANLIQGLIKVLRSNLMAAARDKRKFIHDLKLNFFGAAFLYLGHNKELMQ